MTVRMASMPRTAARPDVVFLMGPTASGKTDLALALADHRPCCLISVDSALVYRGMDIGTAKPEPDILERYPHALVDILDPLESYSAAQFRTDALRLMAAAVERGELPVLAGGTMLYYKALLEGLADMPAADPQVRHQLEQREQAEGLGSLHDELCRVDPESGLRIHANDRQRVLRALEVWLVSGESMTQHRLRQQQQRTSRADLPYTVHAFAMAPASRALLHQRIAQRFDLMLEQGFVEEVEQLMQRSDLHAGLPSMRSVGYRQVWDYLQGLDSYPVMRDKGIAATRQLAKRQFTWLRSWQDLEWIDSLEPNRLAHVLKKL